ncbi:MaoC family dehydratase [Actinophytocola sp.]|uniref:MaoC family dehydratase n=1 Tax=Actinophytocola sp. TaxID=1872138 RepID=UPI003D6C3245
MTTTRRERGFLFEDFEIDRTFDHHWGRTFTAAESMVFATSTMHYNPLYFDDEYARSVGFTRAPVIPFLVFATVLGLSVEDLSEAGGPFLGLEDLRYGQTVYPGDTVRASSVVVAARPSASRPGWGIVEWETTGTNQREEMVIRYRRTNLSRRRAQAEEEPRC